MTGMNKGWKCLTDPNPRACYALELFTTITFLILKATGSRETKGRPDTTSTQQKVNPRQRLTTTFVPRHYVDPLVMAT
jgi:hypothetical protein